MSNADNKITSFMHENASVDTKTTTTRQLTKTPK